jgi:hypothetical protein
MTGADGDTNLLEHLRNVLGYLPVSTPHDRRVIDADLLPGSSRTPVGDEDPFGHRANEAAAHDWWAQVEPKQGRWAT